MTAKYVFPTLTVDGWVDRSISVVDQMLSDFFLSEYSQTYAFTGRVSSFSWILQQYRDDLPRMQQEIQNTLVIYFSTQFNDVEATVTQELREGSINTHSLLLYMRFVDNNGETFTLGRIVKYTGLKVTEVLKTLSEG